MKIEFWNVDTNKTLAKRNLRNYINLREYIEKNWPRTRIFNVTLYSPDEAMVTLENKERK